MMINNRRHSFDADKTRDDYQQVQQVNWSFPLMKMADIKECLNALDMKVTEAQLADVSQNKQLYRDILEYMAEICTGITKEEISQPQFNGLQSLNNPELHEESIPYLHAFRAVAKMMKISGITDFSIKDYLQPSAKRLRRQLSGIINFAKFREERFALLQDVSSERERLVSALNSRKSVKEALEKKLAMLKESGAEQEHAIQAMQEEVHGIENQLTEYSRKQADLRDEIKELKSLNNSLKDGVTARKDQLQENENEVKRLSKQVVNSPERFRKQIIDVGHSLQAEQKDMKMADKKLRELAGWLTYVEEAQCQVGLSLDSMRDVKNEVDKQKNAAAELKELHDATMSARDVLAVLDQNVSTVSRQAARSEEKLAHLRKQTSQRVTEGQHRMNTLHAEILQAEGHAADVHARAERADGDVVRAEREFRQTKQNLDMEVEDMKCTYERLETAVIGHLHKIQSNLVETDQNFSIPDTAPTVTRAAAESASIMSL